MEQAISAFNQWFEDNGGTFHPSISIKDSPHGGLTVKVALDKPAIRPSELLVSCPSTLMISYNNAVTSHVLRPLFPTFQSLPSGEVLITRFYIIEQYLLQSNSRWYPYIQLLPQPGDTSSPHSTTLFNQEDIKWLANTNTGKATVYRLQQWR